jgi:hypothetical protein
MKKVQPKGLIVTFGEIARLNKKTGRRKKENGIRKCKIVDKMAVGFGNKAIDFDVFFILKPKEKE